MARAFQTFADWTPAIVGATSAICLFILAPLGIFRRTRGVSGVGLYIASYVFGMLLWIYGAVATLGHWGPIGLIVGLLLLGFGVVPMGFLALALESKWEWF